MWERVFNVMFGETEDIQALSVPLFFSPRELQCRLPQIYALDAYLFYLSFWESRVPRACWTASRCPGRTQTALDEPSYPRGSDVVL